MKKVPTKKNDRQLKKDREVNLYLSLFFLYMSVHKKMKTLNLMLVCLIYKYSILYFSFTIVTSDMASLLLSISIFTL